VMLVAAFEIKAISFFQPLSFSTVKNDFEGAADDIQKFLPIMSVGFSAAGRGSNAKQVRLHHRGVAPR